MSLKNYGILEFVRFDVVDLMNRCDIYSGDVICVMMGKCGVSEFCYKVGQLV